MSNHLASRLIGSDKAGWAVRDCCGLNRLGKGKTYREAIDMAMDTFAALTHEGKS